MIDTLDAAARDALAWLAERPRVAVAALALVTAVAILPGLFELPAVDRTEVRYAQGAKQMLETGDLMTPRFQDEALYTKPIGIFWLQAASAAIFGEAGRDAIWAYRLPSFLGVLFSILLTYWGVRRLFNDRVAVLTAGLLAVNLIVVLQGHLAMTKAILLVFIVAAQWALARIYVAPEGEAQRRDALIFWAALGVSVMMGTLALPLLSLTTIIGLCIADRSIAWLKGLRILWGFPLAVLLAVPWPLVMSYSPDFAALKATWLEAPFSNLSGPQKMNWRALPGMFLFGAWLGALPVIAFLPLAVTTLWKGRDEPVLRFLAVWIGAYLLALEILSAKPPLYSLQSVMPAIMAAIAFTIIERQQGPFGKINMAAAFLAMSLPVMLLGAVTRLMAVDTLTMLAWIGLLAATVLAVIAIFAERRYAALAGMLGAGLFFYVGTFGLALPRLEAVWTSERLTKVAHALESCLPGPVALAGYTEPSAVFLMGTKTMLRAEGAGVETVARALTTGSHKLALVTEKARPAFEAALGETKVREVACVTGMNFGKFERIAIKGYATASKDELAACPLPKRFRCPEPEPEEKGEGEEKGEQAEKKELPR